MTAQPTHRITGGPWPGRVGLGCTLVADPGDGIYPFDKRMTDGQTIVLVDGDPYTPPQPLSNGTSWTCVISADALCPLDDPCYRVGCIACDFALPDMPTV